MELCPQCGSTDNREFWPPLHLRHCVGCQQLWISRGGGPSERRLIAVLLELAFTESNTASERLEAIEAKLKEAGASADELAVETAQARNMWNDKVPEPMPKAVERLVVESVVQTESPSGYRSPAAPPRRKLRVRTQVGKKATKTLAIAALVLIAAAVAMHAFLDPTWPMIAAVDGFVALMLLAFAYEFATGSSVEMADGVLVIRHRYLLRTTKTVRIPIERIATARLFMRPRLQQQPQVVTVEVVEKDGTVHLIADYVLEEVGKTYVTLIERAVLDLAPVRVRVGPPDRDREKEHLAVVETAEIKQKSTG